MKLSELGQQKVQVISEPQPAKQGAPQSASLRLSEINPEAVSVVAQPQQSAETELDQLKKRTESWLKYPVEIGRQIDRFTGAPVRAAIGAFQDDRELFEQLEGKVAADRWQKEATRHLHDKLLPIPQPTSVESYIKAF
jgi:hypothetical protein